MKNFYLTFIFLLCYVFGFGQSTIVTIDRANGPGPTATGNDPSITSTGITRGAGVSERVGTDFSSRFWTATSQADAQTNNDYIQWSASSSASNEITIEGLDIKIRRNATGPTNWQLFYSLDNFATSGIALNSVQSLPVETDVITNINSLSINTGTSSTITFRLYAWGAATGAGWLRVRKEASWADFGISLPGIRLRGNIATVTANSIESNIIATSFDPTDNINYSAYSATSSLTTTNAIKIGEFTIQDGGDDLLDADALATTLDDLEFNISNSSYLAALAIFDGTTNISEITSVASTTSFTGITGLSAADDSSKTFDIYATFKSAVVDNEQFQLTINLATANALTGSSFLAFDAGGAQTPISGDDNRIEVTATGFVFDQEPTNTFQFETMTPFPTIIAVDSNSNQDVDYNGTISVVAAGSLDPALIDYAIVDGFSSLNSIVFTEQETATSLIVFGGGLSPAISTTFDVNGPLLTIAQQTFDGDTPEWTYSTDVPTFDNGWGTDGYYGIIDLSSASPLNNELFSNNIFGENDLNDEGDNGTTGFATLTFDPIEVSNYNNVKLIFNWDIHGYVSNGSDAQYRLVYDGIEQPIVFLIDGNGPIDTDEGIVKIDIPSTVTTVGLQIRVRNNDLNGYSGFDNFRLVSVFDGLLYANNGWSPYPPSETTGTENAYVFDGNYIVGTDIELDNLYINTLGTVSITEGQSVTTNSNLVNNGTLELNSVSTSYSSLIVSENVSGTVIYNRHVNNTSDPGETGENDLIAPPVFGQTFGDFAAANPNIVEDPLDTSLKLFGPFNKTTGSYQLYDTDVTADANSIFAAGNGYRAASSDAGTFTFTGEVTTATVNVPIVVSGPNAPEWNLIGNPYPSYIKLSDFLASNNSEFDPLSSGVYGYDGDASDGFIIWNQAYSDANPNAVITPGQGFLIASKPGGGTITFTPEMRSIGTTDDFIAGRHAAMAHLKLQMHSATDLYKTDLYFNDNASLGLDAGYDSGVFGGDAPQFSIFSHLVENNQGKDLAIQSLNYDAINNTVIPLGINASQGEQLTISILESNLPEFVDVYLEDTVTNTFTHLNTNAYVFTPSTDLSGTGRFFLRVSEDALSTSEEHWNTIQIYTTKTPKTLFIKGELLDRTTVEIYDIQGRLILNTPLDISNDSNEIDISNFTSGIYVVKLNNGSQQKSQKVIIR